MLPTFTYSGNTIEVIRPDDRTPDMAPMDFPDEFSAMTVLETLLEDPNNAEGMRDLLAEAELATPVERVSGYDLVYALAPYISNGDFLFLEHDVLVAAGTATSPASEEEPVAEEAAEPVEEKRVPLDELEILSITFKSDHNLLKDNSTDWTTSGSRFPKPEWTHDGKNNHPITHTMDKEIELDVEIEAGPPDGEAQNGKLVGKNPDIFEAEKEDHFSAGAKMLQGLSSTGKLEKKVSKISSKRIKWKLKLDVDGTARGNRSGGHTVYLTYDTPRDEGEMEDGVTVKRMEKAIEWVGGAGTLEPHDIVDHLFGKYRGYILGFRFLTQSQQDYLKKNPEKKAELEKAGFAAYMKSDQGGSWPLTEDNDWGGECQAMVRSIRGVLMQAGVPGKAETKYVNANANDPYTPLIKDGGTQCKGPNPRGIYALADRLVEKDEEYDDTSGIGWNNYEAYLRYEHDGRVGWLGGGIGRLPETQNPLNVFYGLAELERVYDAGEVKLKVVELWKYREHDWGTWQDPGLGAP
jgi:hypothetical protein